MRSSIKSSSPSMGAFRAVVRALSTAFGVARPPASEPASDGLSPAPWLPLMLSMLPALEPSRAALFGVAPPLLPCRVGVRSPPSEPAGWSWCCCCCATAGLAEGCAAVALPATPTASSASAAAALAGGAATGSTSALSSWSHRPFAQPSGLRSGVPTSVTGEATSSAFPTCCRKDDASLAIAPACSRAGGGAGSTSKKKDII